MGGSKKIDVEFQSIWDGGTEVIVPAILDLETGRLVYIENWFEPEGAQELDSNSVILKMGGMTAVYDLVVRGDSYFVPEKDLEKIKAFFNNNIDLTKFKTRAELEIDASRLREKLGSDCSNFKFDFDGSAFYNLSFESKLPINNILAVMGTIPDSHVMMRNLVSLETAAKEKSDAGENSRYDLFIEKCKEVCDAYGITLDQYFKITCAQNSIDFNNGVKFNMIHDWVENEKFIEQYKSAKSDVVFQEQNEEDKIVVVDEKINEKLRDMAKISALGTYLSSNINNVDDYEKFMKLESLDGTDLEIWEPFENHYLEEIQELVEQEFSATLHSYMKVAEIVRAAEELENLAAGAGDADKDAVAKNLRELGGDKSTNKDLV
ncbi:MAG: hypothetical protein QG567_2175 [Campylobacterota bacterium]|nr:hypothetical protein [Campylobacterota bacterium]